jgi:hypothetical protein
VATEHHFRPGCTATLLVNQNEVQDDEGG